MELETTTESPATARRRTRRHNRERSAQIQGIAPRSMYGHDEEHRAIAIAACAAKGNIRAHPVFSGRRYVAIVQGRDAFHEDVRVQKIPHGTTREQIDAWCHDWNEDRRDDSIARESSRLEILDRGVRLDLMPFTDANAIIDSNSNGKRGFGSWSKTATSAGVANNWYDMWPVSGNPTGGAINGTARTAVRFTDASTGAINHRGNVSTDTKHMMSLLGQASANTPLLKFGDRAGAYDQCTFSTSNQTMTNTLAPNRYNAGAPGLMPILVTNTALSATAANLTQFRYTDDGGTATQSMPTGTTVSLIVSAAAPSTTLGARVFAPSTSANTVTWGLYLPLATGDNGVRLVEDYTWSAANTGTFTCVLFHELADLILPVATLPAERDTVYQFMELERIYDGACISAFAFMPAATAFTAQVSLRFAWHS